MEIAIACITPVIESCITPVIEWTIVPITKRLGFFLSSKKNVEEMGDGIERLKVTLQNVEMEKTLAAASTKLVSAHVSIWLKNVKEINEKAENIPKPGNGCSGLVKRYKAGKQSFLISQKLKELETEASSFKWPDKQMPLAIVPVNYGTKKIFDSRKLIFKKALEFLKSSNETQQMMALCGMGGVGKTMMMEHLVVAVNNPKIFYWVVKVVVGQNPETKYLQQAIAQYTGEGLAETAQDARADRLRHKFEVMSQEGKKILVIMDDIWKKVDLKDFGLESPLPGLKLLFTSRFDNVCTQMGVQTDSIFKLDKLHDVEAKNLFLGTVGPPVSIGNDPVRQKIGEDIAKKCGGLPIAIVTLAKSLRSEIEEVWERTLSRLKKHNLIECPDVEEIFKISYEILKEEEDKSIFLLSGLFPDDFDIPTEDLLRYGWGLKLFTTADTLADARRQLKISVHNLVHANLLTESDRKGYVKMHDLIRDFVLSNFSGVKQASIVNSDDMSGRLTEDANESYDRILLKWTGMFEFPANFNYPNLSLLILMSKYGQHEFPNDFYEKLPKLEVLSHEGIYTRLFPQAFQHSTKLRTLCLRSCSLMDDFTFLGSLSNLETLSFAHCEIKRLPSTIGKLIRLKLLDLTGCVGLCIDEGVFQKLVRLEELYMKTSKSSSIRFTDANCDELEILSQQLSALELEFFKNKARPNNVSFKKLERFRISIGRELESLVDYKKMCPSYSFRNTLNLVGDCGELLESKISELFEKTEELYLQVNDMIRLSDVSMHHSFFNLRDLHVESCAELTYLFTIPVASGLKKLERLKISRCRKLISLCDMTSVDVIELPKLVELILFDGLPNITSIYPDYDNVSVMQSFLSKEVVIPKLEKLKISKMENLKQIWPGQITAEKNNVSMLKELEVEECESLVNLFPSNPLPLLNHLEELYVSRCGSIEVLFNIDLERVCEMEGNIISSLRKVEVFHSGNLRELWRMNRGLNNSSSEDILLINAFKAVETIWIVGCRLEYIFTPTSTNFNLGALTTCFVSNAREEMETDIECSQEINVISKGEISEITDSIPKVTYTSHMLHACHHLQHLQLKNDKRVGVVFEMDSPNRRELPPIQDRQQPLTFPYLEVLHLDSLEKMSRVWKCNWNNFLLIPQQPPPMEFPFRNLKEINLWYCNKIKYLFSPLMAKFLSNLKEVVIQGCDAIEEVVSSRDDEITTSTSSHTNTTTLFPHFDTLNLWSLKCLKRIDGGDASRSDKVPIDITTTSIHDQFQGAQVIRASWSLCQYPKNIHAQGCDTLSSLIPWYAVGQMKKLEDLLIYGCNSMLEIFESQMINNIANVDEGSECGGTGTRATLTSPRLNVITAVPQLSNLKRASISNCNLLQHVFTFSTLESLEQLTSLTIKNCKDIEVIVKEENGEQTAASKVVLFPRLETLELVNLPNLQGFFLGMNEFRWPLLNKVTINDCSKMEVFTSGPSKTPKLKYISSRLGKYILDQTTSTCLDPSISQACSFHNLVELDMKRERLDEEEYIIPSNALPQLGKLEKINIQGCEGEKEGVFEVVALEQGTNNINSGFNDQSPATVVKIPIPNLREVNFESSGLRYIWKSNPWMVLEFPNLTTVSIQRCDMLEHVFTCSMVGSLAHLQDLYISHCRKMEVIVKRDEKLGAKEGVFEVAALEQGTNNINSGFNDQSPVTSPTTVVKISIPNLREVKFESSGLRYIWKSNPWMVLEFPNLTTVFIEDCNMLEHVFTCSMVGSLVHLQYLNISRCDKMEVIVKRDELEKECDDANVINEIIKLPGLKSLQLEGLSNLQGFCLGKEAFLLPSLYTLKVNKCPAFTVFNAGRLDTPELKVIDTNFGIYDVKEDLNSLIKVKQQEGAFGESN